MGFTTRNEIGGLKGSKFGRDQGKRGIEGKKYGISGGIQKKQKIRVYSQQDKVEVIRLLQDESLTPRKYSDDGNWKPEKWTPAIRKFFQKYPAKLCRKKLKTRRKQ